MSEKKTMRSQYLIRKVNLEKRIRDLISTLRQGTAPPDVRENIVQRMKKANSELIAVEGILDDLR